jgi:hypothetical protein
MTRTEKFACAGCDRRFLSASTRRRHYEWNPDHGATAPDAGTRSLDDRWIEFGDRIETFLTLDDDARRVDVEYRPDEGTVAIEDPCERRIDVSEVRESASDRVRWTFDGRYLVLTVSKSSRSV